MEDLYNTSTCRLDLSELRLANNLICNIQIISQLNITLEYQWKQKHWVMNKLYINYNISKIGLLLSPLPTQFLFFLLGFSEINLANCFFVFLFFFIKVFFFQIFKTESKKKKCVSSNPTDPIFCVKFGASLLI